MTTDLRTSILASVVVAASVVVVVARIVTAPAPPASRPATPTERAEMARLVAGAERGWTNETAQNFPSDSWSQRDDFHSREARKIQELVKERGARIEDGLRAIDDDIHRRGARSDADPDDRNARAVPCKPRAFYD